ncbi:MAG: serine protease [Bacteroidetes bacterium 4484_249]|nr:MAG: serine protease [Bacteroidetes bacterium 4484_249]
MIKSIYKSIFLLFSLSVIFNIATAQDSTIKETFKVYIFDIKEEIAPPVWHKTQKAFEKATEINADLILIHMNTYGGMLDAADSIRTAILRSNIPVYVFIDNNAASAGALISIACDSIYMTPGGNIGAATVVDQTGKPLPDKYQSYMRSMMRSTAESKNRDPDIAQAMVDPRIYIEGVTDTGRVLTFTASEALEHKFCEGIAESVIEVLELANIEDYEIVEQELTAADRIIRFLINPMVSGILIMVIVGGIYFELQTPGIGFPIAASVIAALLYFAPLYIEGLAEHWEIVIFIIGIILIAVEIFAIPGFGVPGILGIIFIVAGLTLSMTGNIGFDFSGIPLIGLITSFFTVITATFLSLLLSIYFSRKVFTTTAFGHLALDSTQQADKGFTSSDNIYKTMVGQRGVAFTVLRPAGKVKIEDEVFDATAETGFIEKGESIKVTGYQTSQLIVAKA